MLKDKKTKMKSKMKTKMKMRVDTGDVPDCVARVALQLRSLQHSKRCSQSQTPLLRSPMALTLHLLLTLVLPRMQAQGMVCLSENLWAVTCLCEW